ncbi:MAG: SDR family NAD(P)-dependent oxidoreductase [Akkermansiaceae bacterium]
MSSLFKHVLVTGGAGFIGSHVCEALLAEGCRVTVLDDFNNFYDPKIKERHLTAFRDRIAVEKGDIRDQSLVDKVFQRGDFDAVVHLAARAGVRPSLLDPRLYVSTNIDGTLNLLEACREHEIKRFIFASSSSVYGVNEKVPFAEDDLIQRTISPYAATKLMGEQLCSNYSNLYGIQCVCLRFFTVYGPRQRPDLAIAKFTKKIISGQVIDQYGDGSSARDYTFIDDIVSGVLSACRWDQSMFEIFNLGGSETNTLSQLIHVIEDRLGEKAKINLLPNQPGDVPRTFADVSKAKKMLGYSPKTTLEEGIEKYVDWIKG